MTAAAATPGQDGGLVGWVLDLMERLGEIGVGLAVLAETFLPPIPSEAVLPVAGYLAYQGRMDPWLAVVTATAGSLVGAWLWWGVGAAFGRRRTRALVERVPLAQGLPVLAANSPAKLYDALAVGTPVVVTNPGWTKTLVEQYGCGWYAPAGDAGALAATGAGTAEPPADSADVSRWRSSSFSWPSRRSSATTSSRKSSTSSWS